MRRIKDPDRFLPTRETARTLREIASQIESTAGYADFSLTVYWATTAEIEAAKEKLAKKKPGA